MKTITTTIDLSYPAEHVYQVLTDFKQYADWNPFIISSKGEAVVGTRLHNTMVLPNSKPLRFKPKIITVIENKELSWLGNTIIPGIFDGEHRFIIEATTTEHSQLTQSEKFTGILTYLMKKSFWQTIEAAFKQMNHALAVELAKRHP